MRVYNTCITFSILPTLGLNLMNGIDRISGFFSGDMCGGVGDHTL